MDNKLSPCTCVGQVARQRDATLGSDIKLSGKEAMSAASFGLGSIHRHIGSAEQVSGVITVDRILPDANASTYLNFMIFDLERIEYGGKQLMHHILYVLITRD